MIDNILHNRLLDIMSATDEEMRPNQRYNIPHFVDMKLQLYKKLYKLNAESGFEVYGYQYSIGNLFADDIGADTSDMGWKDKVYMNINMNMDTHLYTPFIVFAKLEDGTYAAININNVSVYKTIHAKSYLILQGEHYYPPEDLKILLIPFNVDYHCTDMNEEFYVYNGTTFNLTQYGTLWNPEFDEIPYESIRMRFDNKVKMFTGKIGPNDVAIRVNSVPYGSKVYLDNILLFNSAGELVFDPSIYLIEKENNIFEINKNVSMIGWRYIVFYNVEADTSLSNIYSIPEYIIDHDSIVRITGEGKYILGEENFKAIIDTSNALTADDLRSLYASHTDDVLVEYNDFLNEWLDRIVKYRKKLVEDLINTDEVNVYKEFTFYSVSYTLRQLKSKSNDGEVVFHRVMWRMYDDTSYSGYCDILLFIDGLLSMEYVNYDWDSKEYHILVADIQDDLGLDVNIELVYITNVRDKLAEMIIPFGRNNKHVLYADRYYEPRLSNFFTLTPEPLIPMQGENDSATLRQPLNFEYEKLGDGIYNIQFDENWIKVANHNSSLDTVSMHDRNMTIANNDNVVNYSIDDLLDKSSIEDYSENNPCIETDTVSENDISIVAQVNDTIAYIKNGKLYADDMESIDIPEIYENADIEAYCDNFVENKLAVSTTDGHIVEFDGDDIKAGAVNVIDLSIMESATINEEVRKDIIVPFDCSATYIPDRDMVVVLENGWIAEGDTPRVMLIAMRGSEYLGSIMRLLPEPIRTIGSKIIQYSNSEILIYGGSEEYHDATNKLYKYNIDTEELTLISTIPDTIGMIESGLWYDNDHTLYVFGGLNTSRSTKPAMNIGIYDFNADTWDYVSTNHIFIASVLAESETHLALVGGYKSRAIDISNIKDDIIVIDKSKISDRGYLESLDVTSKAPNPIVDARSINDLKRDTTFLVGSREPSNESIVYRLHIDTGICTTFGTPAAVEYDWNDIVSINYTENGTALYIQSVGDVQYAFSKLVSFVYNPVISLFIDTYGVYHALVKNHIYAYENGIWGIIADVTRINEISPIKKIMLSGMVFIALLENGKLISSPNLDVWYWYNFNIVPEQVTDIRFSNGEYPVSLIQTSDGKVYANPYLMNMSSYYDNYIAMSSKNRFAYQVEYVDYDEEESVDVIELDDEFEYCLDPSHFMLFYNGRLSESDTYDVVLPSLESAVNRSCIYLKFEIKEDCVLTVVYTTFNTEIIHREDTVPSDGIITMKNTDMFNKYGLGRNFYWLFSQGKKIPYNELRDISNNMIQIKNAGHMYDDINTVEAASDEKTELITFTFSNISEDAVEYDVNKVMCYKNNDTVAFSLDIEATVHLDNIIPDLDIEIDIDGIKPFTSTEMVGEISPLIGFKDVNDGVYIVSVADTTKIKLCIPSDDGMTYLKYLNINPDLGGNIIILSDVTAFVEKTVEHRYNALCIMQTAELFNTDEFDIDEFNKIMDYFIRTLSDFGMDKFYVENIKSIKDMEASIEDKVILLRIYADHYVANSDRYGNTPPFKLDSEYPIYPLLNGN